MCSDKVHIGVGRFRTDPLQPHYLLPPASLCSSYMNLFTPPAIRVRTCIRTIGGHAEGKVRYEGKYARREHTRSKHIREWKIVEALDVCVELKYDYEGGAEVLCIWLHPRSREQKTETNLATRGEIYLNDSTDLVGYRREPAYPNEYTLTLNLAWAPMRTCVYYIDLPSY